MDRNNYDDMTGGGYRQGRKKQSGGSGKLIVIIIFVGIIVCALAVYAWIKYFPPEKPADDPPVVTDTTQDAVTDPVTTDLDDTPVVSLESLARQGGQVTGDTSPVVSPTTTARTVQNQPTSPTSDSDVVQYGEHIVQSDEDILSIAAAYGLRAQTLLSVNQIKNISAIVAGTALKIPDRDGQLYVVQEGDMLSTITQRYNPSLGWKTLQDLNGLPSEHIKVGQTLFIPDPGQGSATISSASVRFVRPLSGEISALYGQTVRDPATGLNTVLEGIRMTGKASASVVAAADGIVVDTGFENPGLGRFVILTHESGYRTTYAHLESVGVKIGEQVKQGEALGSLGATGTEFTTPTLFFSIEQSGISLNPMNFF